MFTTKTEKGHDITIHQWNSSPLYNDQSVGYSGPYLSLAWDRRKYCGSCSFCLWPYKWESLRTRAAILITSQQYSTRQKPIDAHKVAELRQINRGNLSRTKGWVRSCVPSTLPPQIESIANFESESFFLRYIGRYFYSDVNTLWTLAMRQNR